MGSWLDKWAKRAATAAPSDVPPTGSTAESTPQRPAASRRDFLKKAGIVGGVAWSVPVMQTVLAPACRSVHVPGRWRHLRQMAATPGYVP